MRVSEREVGADQEQRGECATPAITATGDDNRETDRQKGGEGWRGGLKGVWQS